MLLGRGDFREKLKDELDQVYSLLSSYKKYSEGLDAAADSMEEFIGAEVSSMMLQLLVTVEQDVAKLSNQLVEWRKELELRREAREKRIDQVNDPGLKSGACGWQRPQARVD
jgi:flagellar biosynthesis chaperone FliJ